MGTLLLSAVNNGDTQIVLPWMLVVGAIIIVFNLLADVAVRPARPAGADVMSDDRPDQRKIRARAPAPRRRPARRRCSTPRS